MNGTPLWIDALKAIAVLAIALTAVPALALAERRVFAFLQLRIGPNRVGPLGTLPPPADLVKMIFKEERRPRGAHPWISRAAPVIRAVCALTMAGVVPFGGTLAIGGWRIPLTAADIELGVLIVLAASSMSVYGIALGAWSSNRKDSLLGGLRSPAQRISYELTLGLALLAVLLVSGDAGPGSLRLGDIVARQAERGFLGWNVFRAPLGLLLFTVAAFAPTHRLPFDRPEAEPERVGGFHAEDASPRSGLIFVAEYAATFVASCLLVALFFGGWHLPLVSERLVVGPEGAAVQGAVFLAKVAAFLFILIPVRWTLSRLPHDSLLSLGWKVALPLGLANLMLTGVLVGICGF